MPRAPAYKKGYSKGTPVVSAATYQQIIGHLLRDNIGKGVKSTLRGFGKKRSTPYVRNTPLNPPTAKQLAHRQRFAAASRLAQSRGERMTAAHLAEVAGGRAVAAAERMEEAVVRHTGKRGGAAAAREEDFNETIAGLLSPASKR